MLRPVPLAAGGGIEAQAPVEARVTMRKAPAETVDYADFAVPADASFFRPRRDAWKSCSPRQGIASP